MKKLVIAFVGLNALDITLTLVAVNGGATELNPVMAKVLELPLPAILSYKIALPLLLGLSVIGMGKTKVGKIIRPKSVLTVAVLAMVGVCLFNIGGLAV